jgi:hypothetical protein
MIIYFPAKNYDLLDVVHAFDTRDQVLAHPAGHDHNTSHGALDKLKTSLHCI